MRVFVAGATGVIGSRAVDLLAAGGHTVTGVARTDDKARALEAAGATPARIDIFDAVAVRRAVEGHDVVMNLATHIPPLSKAALSSAWHENDRIRVEASRNLVAAAISAGAGRYVQESIALFYPDRGGEWIDESVDVEPPALARTFLDAEGQARRFTDDGGVGVALRFGAFYAADSGQTLGMLKLARLGVSPFPGSRDEYFPTVHADDAAGAAVSALVAPAGLYNVAAEPQTKGEAAEQLAALVGRKKLRFPPRAVMAAAGPGAKALMRSSRVSSSRFREATGWSPSYRTVADGFAEVLRTARP